jgi:hypothetical protein
VNDQQRRRFLVDPKVQGSLLLRVFTYWAACLSAVFLLLAIVPLAVCGMVVESPPPVTQLLAETCRALWPALLASLMVLPFILIDCLRLSNRFAGPMLRLRRAMNRLARGESVEPIKFRDEDFWYDFTEDYNRLAVRVRQLERRAGESASVQAPAKAGAKSEETGAPISA